MVILIVILFCIPIVIMCMEAKKIDKNLSFKSIFSYKSFRKEFTIVKDIIGGEWTLSPDRIFYQRLGVSGKYKGRDIQSEYEPRCSSYSSDYSPDVICFKVKTSIDWREIVLFGQHPLLDTGYFIADEKGYLIAYMIPLTNFFEPMNIRSLLDTLLIVADSLENKDIDKAVQLWKNMPEKCCFRKSEHFFLIGEILTAFRQGKSGCAGTDMKYR